MVPTNEAVRKAGAICYRNLWSLLLHEVAYGPPCKIFVPVLPYLQSASCLIADKELRAFAKGYIDRRQIKDAWHNQDLLQFIMGRYVKANYLFGCLLGPNYLYPLM
jgi:hypothetical protein